MTTVRFYPENVMTPSHRIVKRYRPNGVNKMGVSGNFPRTNITKLENAFVIELALAGYSREEIEIKWNENERTLSFIGTPKDEEKNENSKVISRGFTKRSFKKIFNISRDLDAENIEARMQDGVLAVKIMTKTPIIKKVELK
jgi:HSP20 family molecular chaperone IbpA